MRVSITKNLLSGLLFFVLGGGAALIASQYKLGTAMQMGPGYFPVLLGCLIALIGAVVFVRALLDPESSEKVAHWDVRPLVFVLAAILVFGALIDTYGLIAAVVALILVGRLAGREGTLLELALMVVVLTAVAVGVFVYALNVPLQLRPW